MAARAWPEMDATADGMFHECGPQSKPAAGQQPVRAMMVSDGLSNTLLLGERNPGDPNMDSYQNAPFATPPDPPILAMTAYCGWGSPTGPSAIVSATFSGWASVNFMYPRPYVPPIDGVEVPLNWNEYKDDWSLRLAAPAAVIPAWRTSPSATVRCDSFALTFPCQLFVRRAHGPAGRVWEKTRDS